MISSIRERVFFLPVVAQFFSSNDDLLMREVASNAPDEYFLKHNLNYPIYVVERGCACSGSVEVSLNNMVNSTALAGSDIETPSLLLLIKLCGMP